MMVTLGYMVIDAQAGTVEYANAGHPFPHLLVRRRRARARGAAERGRVAGDALRRPDQRQRQRPRPAPPPIRPTCTPAGDGHWLWLHAPGVPLGVAARPHYPTVRLPLGAVEAVCLYSDGVIEARNRRARCSASPACTPPAGLYRRSTPTSHSSTAAAAGVVQRVVTFADGTPVDDDMTVLLVRRLPQPPTALWPRPMPMCAIRAWPTNCRSRRRHRTPCWRLGVPPRPWPGP